MIRPFTCICMLVAAGSGLYVYQSKHRVQVVDREILRTLKAADAAHERVAMLKAEWALLNEPERLQDLAGRFLSLKPMAPGQFVSLADLTRRLPPPGAIVAPPPPLPDTLETPVATVPVAAAEPHAPPAAKPAAPAAVPLQVAAKPPAEKPPAEKPAPDKVVVAHLRLPTQPVVARAPSLPQIASLPSTPAEPQARMTRGAAFGAGVPVVASALGGSGGALPAPVPVGAARAVPAPVTTARDSP